jgi:hypothetical protein
MALERTAVVVYPPIATVWRRCGSSARAPAGKLRYTCHPVRDPFDQPQGGRRGAQRHREEAREQRCWDLVADVRQDARDSDRAGARREPGRSSRCSWSRGLFHPAEYRRGDAENGL